MKENNQFSRGAASKAARVSAAGEMHTSKANGKGVDLKIFLTLAPINVLCLLLAAVAVIGISSVAKKAYAADAIKPPADAVTDPLTDPMTAPNTDPVTEPATDTVTAPVTEPITAPVTEPITEPLTDAPVYAPATEGPIREPEPIINYEKYHPEFARIPTLLGTSIVSDYAIIVDIAESRVVASRNSETRMYPASMTKVMTLYVASRYLTEDALYTETYKMTNEIINPLYLENATRAGFLHNEEVLLIDYMYGTILPSGADATMALANFIAGSEGAFAELMNATARELGLKNTHFTNCTGLHDRNHYTTAYDMAVIMNAAMDDPICRKVLSTAKYTTHSTPQNPNGITMYSTALSRLSPYNTSDVTFFAGKTGFTDQAKQCLASVSRTKDGKEYIMVTAHAVSKYDAVDDAVKSIKRHCAD